MQFPTSDTSPRQHQCGKKPFQHQNPLCRNASINESDGNRYNIPTNRIMPIKLKINMLSSDFILVLYLKQSTNTRHFIG